MKNVFLVMVGGAALVMALACGGDGDPDAATPATKTPERLESTGSFSWSAVTEDVGVMTAGSEVVVRVQLGEDVDLVPFGRQIDGRHVFFNSIYDAEVLEVGKGDFAVGDRVRIVQSGGETAEVIHTVNDSAPLDPGGEYIVFIGYAASDDAYRMFGESLGRIEVRDGKGWSLSQTDPELADLPDLRLAGRDVDDIMAEVVAHKDDPRPPYIGMDNPLGPKD